MSDQGQEILSRKQLRELIRDEMEALGFNDAMPGQLAYIAESMKLLVGGPKDPNIPEWLQPNPVIFEIRDKADTAATLAAATDKTLTSFMGTTTTQLSALQKGQHRSRSMFSRAFAILRKEITDKEDGKVDWKRVGLLAGGLATVVHGAFTWIPKTIKIIVAWFHSLHA